MYIQCIHIKGLPIVLYHFLSLMSSLVYLFKTLCRRQNKTKYNTANHCLTPLLTYVHSIHFYIHSTCHSSRSTSQILSGETKQDIPQQCTFQYLYSSTFIQHGILQGLVCENMKRKIIIITTTIIG